MRPRHARGFAVAALAVLAVALTACSGLPTSGGVQAGLALGEADAAPDINQLASGPVGGADPDEIVEGFLDAALTPTDGWSVARQFLAPELAETWRPSAGVTIDAGAADRSFSSDLAEDDEDATESDVRVLLDQTARVDESGAYSELSGDAAVVTFELARDDEGEWRITSAPDGIVLDAEAFRQVYRGYALQYFDQGWTRLVPDMRWYPWRSTGTIATTLTQALLEGAPSDWLAPAVRTAFPADVMLAAGSVPVTASKVAQVELNDAALSLEPTQLSRMRTQLEATLRPAGVDEVQLAVGGRDLDAGRASVETAIAGSGMLVLTESGFGPFLGDEITEIPGMSRQIVDLGSSVETIDLAADSERAAVQLDTGVVCMVTADRVDELDTRAGLVAPSLDPYGYTWTAPASDPSALTAWRPDVTSATFEDALPEISSISHLRVASDGSRLATIVTIGSQRWIAVAAIVRDEDRTPVELGPVHLVAQLAGAGIGLAWIGDTELGVLMDDDGSPVFVTQDVGGPGLSSAAPSGAVALAGARTSAGVRMLDEHGVVFAQRGTTWQTSLSGVLVLGTHAGQ